MRVCSLVDIFAVFLREWTPGSRLLPECPTGIRQATRHARSIRVAEKCGFKEVQRTTYKGEPTILFSR
jgi:hypothetical protein